MANLLFNVLSHVGVIVFFDVIPPPKKKTWPLLQKNRMFLAKSCEQFRLFRASSLFLYLSIPLTFFELLQLVICPRYRMTYSLFLLFCLWLVDVDECLLGTAVCPGNSRCVNQEPEYICQCLSGYAMSNSLCVGKFTLRLIQIS